ncbi:hypothetical protein L1887_13589 [Cichorium endivia]|nr:hypothetical protein L1887_13589 [Cichorium endivia]
MDCSCIRLKEVSFTSTSRMFNQPRKDNSCQYPPNFIVDITQNNPILGRIDCKVGHGSGCPTKKVIDNWADLYGFMAKVVGAICMVCVPLPLKNKLESGLWDDIEIVNIVGFLCVVSRFKS